MRGDSGHTDWQLWPVYIVNLKEINMNWHYKGLIDNLIIFYYK